MTGRGDPPEGTPESVPGGGDDEYRSVVFDESFVRAARIQEFSAQERMVRSPRAVRTRHSWNHDIALGAHRQALVLMLLIALTFGTAIYLGIRHPYRQPAQALAQPLRITLIPLAPHGTVPPASDDPLFTAGGGARYAVGADGYAVPPAQSTANFTQEQVARALEITKDYLVASSLDAAALTGGDVRRVRELLNPGQLAQFDESLARPADDGQHAATGWLVRFEPARYELAHRAALVRGTITVDERSPDGLTVTTDHTLVYTVRGTATSDHGAASAPFSHFTVRRWLRLYFTPQDLLGHQVEVEEAVVEAGPLACSADSAAYFRPLAAGASAAAAVIDPYDRNAPVAASCALLKPGPSPAPRRQSPLTSPR